MCAGDVDGDGGATTVAGGDRENLGDDLAGVELVQGIGGGVGPHACGVDGKGAVGASGGGLSDHGGIGGIRIGDHQRAAGGEHDVALGQGHSGAGEGGDVLCAGDVDGDGGGGEGAVGILQRVAENILLAVVGVQGLGGGIGDIGIGAVGGDGECSVGAHQIGGDTAGDGGGGGHSADLGAGDGGGICAQGIGRGGHAVEQIAGDAGVILGDGTAIGIGHRRGVGDEDIQAGGGIGIALGVGDDQGEAVDDVTGGVVGAGAGWVVAIGDLAGEGIKAGDGQCAIGACYGNRSAWRSGCEGYSRNHCGTQGQTGQAIGGGDREGVADGGVLSHAHIGAAHAGVVAGDGDHGQAIGHTGDGHGDGGGGEGAVGILQGVAENIILAVTGIERLGGGIGDIGVGAIGSQGQVTVGAMQDGGYTDDLGGGGGHGADLCAGDGGGVCTQGIGARLHTGEHIAGDTGCVFGDGTGIGQG